MPAISKLAFRGPVLVAPRVLCVTPAWKSIPFAIVRQVNSESPVERVSGDAQKAKDKVKQVVDKVRGIDELIVTDHQSIRELYDRYQKEVDEIKKEAIVNEFIREVALHSAAEEMILYPVLDSLSASESRIDVGNLRGGHQKIKNGLYHVDEMMSSKGKGEKSASVEKMLAGVMKDLEEHMKTEEQSDLVRVQKKMDDATRKRLGLEFSFAKTHVPTRPHPSAPDTGGLKEFMAGLPAAMLDRVRDMGKDFAERRIQ